MTIKGVGLPRVARRLINSLPSMSGSLRSSSIRSAEFWLCQAIASWPEWAVAVTKPSRFSAFWMRLSKPASSSTMRMRAGLLVPGVSILGGDAFGNLGDLHDTHEEADVLYRFGKFVVVYRLHDVVVAAQFVTAR